MIKWGSLRHHLGNFGIVTESIPYNDMNLIAFIICHLKPVQYCNLNIILHADFNFDISLLKTCKTLHRPISCHWRISQSHVNI